MSDIAKDMKDAIDARIREADVALAGLEHIEDSPVNRLRGERSSPIWIRDQYIADLSDAAKEMM